MPDHALIALLTRRLADEGLPAESPISIAELHRRLVPYVVCRDALGLATKAEYDMALLRLLANPGLQVQERALREAVERELTSPEPGLAILQRFAASEVRLAESDSAPESVGGGKEAASPGPPPFTLETEKLDQDRIPGLDDLEYRPTAETAGAAEAPPDSCVSCGGGLPSREGLRYCPACGADQRSWPCGGCGAEVERGWKFCAMCGARQPG